MQHAKSRQAYEPELALLPDDEEALEAWIHAGRDPSRVPSVLRDRAQRVDVIGQLLTKFEPPTLISGRAARIDRVMEAAAAETAARPFAFSAAPGAAPSSGWRLGDLVSLAAVLLIAASVAFPVLSTARKYSMQNACEANLGSLASALSAYGADYSGALPRLNAGLAGPWWDIGMVDRSNSANLVALPRLGYTSIDHLACPGNPNASCETCIVNDGDWSSLDEVSYSYRLAPVGTADVQWAFHEPTIVLADCSPVVRRARAGQPIFPFENSPNHAGRGQTALRTDGSSVWLSSPVYGRDNIWLPRFMEDAIDQIGEQIRAGKTRGTIELRGIELPNANDIMLAP
jgi:hypothetical protein